MRHLVIFLSLFFCCNSLNGQDATARIHGKITGTDRKPLPGVSVGVAGTPLGVISDEHGEYSITVPSNRELSIVFSSIGFEQATVKLILAEGEKKQIYFNNPDVLSNNAILDELETFADAINNNTTPIVTLEDGTEALKVALEIVKMIS